MAVLSLVEVQNLTCERGGRRIFKEISFAAAAGQVLTLEGPNGAGKSSALRILAGLLPQAAGEIRLQMSAGYAVTDHVGLKRLIGLPAQYLSAGQRRRLSLARLILSNRPLWLLDEPLSSLDAAGRRIAAELIGEHCDDGGIAIAATHET